MSRRLPLVAVRRPTETEVRLLRKQAENLSPDLREDAWTRVVASWSRTAGWFAYHTHRSDRSEPGFPDLVLVQSADLLDGARPRVAFVELKRSGPRMRYPEPAQRVWLAALRRALPNVAVWRPTDGPAVLDYLLTPEEHDRIPGSITLNEEER